MARWPVNPALLAKALGRSVTPGKYFLPGAPVKPSKYHNQRTTTGGKTFDSKREAARYEVLLLLERAGKISQLTRQNSFDLVVNGVSVGRYVADFGYIEEGKQITEDSKGVRTSVYRLKKKLMAAIYGIAIKET